MVQQLHLKEIGLVLKQFLVKTILEIRFLVIIYHKVHGLDLKLHLQMINQVNHTLQLAPILTNLCL